MPRRPARPQKPSVSPPAPQVFQIRVPDNDDWYAFCAALLSTGQAQWWFHGNRQTRLEEGDPTLPTFETWGQWKKALLRVGRLYWDAQTQVVTKAGRPNKFFTCWRAFHKALKEGIESGRYTLSEDDLIPRFKGRPITQGEIERMMCKADSTLSLKVSKKYARALHIIVTNRNLSNLSKSDDAFLEKYLRTVLHTVWP